MTIQEKFSGQFDLIVLNNDKVQKQLEITSSISKWLKAG